MTPNWDHVRVFLAVARTGQFLAAARALTLDHATVARRISLLETSLGTQLFARSTAGVSLTVAGEKFVAAAEAMETAWLDAQADVSQVDRVISGTIRVGAPEGFGALFLAPRLGRLAERHPDLTIQLVPLQRTMSLSKRDADLAIVIDPPPDGRLTVRKLTDYGLGLYAAHNYFQRRPVPAKPEDLRRHLMVTSVQELHYSEALTYYPPAFDAGQRRLECASVLAQMEAVKAGAGIGVLHDYATRDAPDLVRVLPQLSIRRTYHLVAHVDTRRIARIDEAYRFVVESVEAAGDLFL
ncbi:MAG: LysR family transcriptional regulator [Proteobacteria bacterium]|nr:LysR family transcriptional regulator [Pseudomonadota bacterium]